MNRLIAIAFLASALIGAGATQAMPLAPLVPAANADVIEVAGGCGPGWHRGPYGGCVRNGVVVVRPAPEVVVVAPRARVCPYGFVWAYGRCRPV